MRNLEANPDAVVAYRERRVALTARVATRAEAETALAGASAIYPGYGKYARWAANREIRVFILERAAGRDGD